MNSAVRFGELAQTGLSRWPIKPLRGKATAGFCYLTIGGKTHWLMLREGLFSLYHAWEALPEITVVSDGSWTVEEFQPVFGWWPGTIKVVSREQICAQARVANEADLAQYAENSPYGLKLAAIILLARRQPLLFVDADILWFRDPVHLIGLASSWGKPKGIRESNCYQRRDMALRYCPQVMEPPFVNGGILAVHGEFLPPDMLHGMVREALADPGDGTFEQTIIATGVKLGGGFLDEKLCLVEFDDVKKFRHRNMLKEGFYARHYVNWMRHLLYLDAFVLRLRKGLRD
jgi:hypothetical protein